MFNTERGVFPRIRGAGGRRTGKPDWDRVDGGPLVAPPDTVGVVLPREDVVKTSEEVRPETGLSVPAVEALVVVGDAEGDAAKVATQIGPTNVDLEGTENVVLHTLPLPGPKVGYLPPHPQNKDV